MLIHAARADAGFVLVLDGALHSRLDLDRIVPTLRSYAHLQSFVQSAEFGLHCFVGDGPEPDDNNFEEDLGDTLELMPNLVRLNVRDLQALELETVAALHQLKQLKHFTTRPLHSLCEYNGKQFARLLAGWSRLECLEMAFFFFSSHAWTTEPCSSKLTTLDLTDAALTDNEVKWITKSSADSLRSFGCRETRMKAEGHKFTLAFEQPAKLTDAGLVSIVGRLTNLRSLRLEVPAPTSAGVAEILPKLDQLESLLLHASVIDQAGLSTAPDLLKHLILAAPDLEGVLDGGSLLDVVNGTTPGGLAATQALIGHLKALIGHLKTCSLGRISAITLTSDWAYSSWCGLQDEIKAVCARRLIEFQNKSSE